MKIEIDLNDILGDEYGSETLQESIKRQVIENLTKKVSDGISKRIDQEVNSVINTSIASAVEERMQGIVDDILTTPYQPVDRWGSSVGAPTTFREALVKSIHENMVYKKTQYSSDANIFTKSVDAVIAEQMKIISALYKETVDQEIGKQAFALAISSLKTKLGLQ